MGSFRALPLLCLLLAAGCAISDAGLEPRGRNASSWPLNVFSGSSEAASVTTVTRGLQFYFVCQTHEQPRPDEAGSNARWKINFYTFTRQEMDYFDSETKSITSGYNLQFDEVGGWFLVVPVMDDVGGDYGITRRGVVFMRRDLAQAKLGPGIIRCKYKYPNPQGVGSKDQFDSSDMTMLAIAAGTQGGTQEPPHHEPIR